MKKVLIINLFFILILTTIFPTVSASIVTNDSLSNSIDNVNYILERNTDLTNTYNLTEILDDNNNVPAYDYYPTHIPSRAIKTLKAYDGKIFMGLGDWGDNTGPAKIIYYDTQDGKIKSSGTIDDEAVQLFNIIDGNLYTTGCDPRGAWGEGNYYVYDKEQNKWNKHTNNNGWIHVFNIVKFKEKLFICGSTEASSEESVIQFSSDNGSTFENVQILKDNVALPYNSSLRCYNLTVVNNKLYGYIVYSKYTGIYEYDEQNNEFNYISDLPTANSSSYGSDKLALYNETYFRHEIFNNNYIYISGTSLYKSSDLKTFKEIKTNTNDVIQDVAIDSDTLYTLSYIYNSDKTFTTRIYSTKNLSDFNLIYEFITDTPPFSMEYYNNSFYIGTAYATLVDSKVPSKNGSFYKIDVKNGKKLLELNENKSIIYITDDSDTYSVNYDLSNENSIFKTNITFDNNMSQSDWEKEYSKLEKLNLIFATISDTKGIEVSKAIQYFNNVLSKNIEDTSKTYSSAIEYAKDTFKEDLNIDDELFNIITEKVNVSENKYEVQVILTIKDSRDFSIIERINSSDNQNNADIDNNTSMNNNTITNDNNTNTNDINNNYYNETNSVNSEVENYINSNSKLPETGKDFSIRNVLQIVLVIWIVIIAVRVKKF